MVLRRTETLPQCSIETTTTTPMTGRAEIVVAIDDLAANIKKLAVKLDHIIALGEAAKVTSSSKGLNRADGSDFQDGNTAEGTNFPLSPHPDSWMGNVRSIDITDEAITPKLTKLTPKDCSPRAKNAIAARVLDLHDRLGGFIKAVPPGPSDPKR